MVTVEPMGRVIAIATLIAGLVCTSRLIVSDHHPMEVYTGVIVAALCQFVAFYIIM
jgi:membrane-associated phospholipid phosphatase